ncbi:hypothetical protein AcetOrient_orf05048 [Acetobacter orientalis]|uniref:Uncharacterized protein n=1 Tax=Acetobacter orientalis TaxID=146474 RepID=A0A2Z5ZME6_9PROT|nr:hypothetical protein AcetOrient_orf05048 [Acetobacter orientalis]
MSIAHNKIYRHTARIKYTLSAFILNKRRNAAHFIQKKRVEFTPTRCIFYLNG